MKSIEQMAEEAGFTAVNGLYYRSGGLDGVSGEDLARFAALVAEECAKIATVEEALKLTHGRGNPSTVGAVAIRAVCCGVDSYLLERP